MGRTACTEPQCLYKAALYLYLTLPYGISTATVVTRTRLNVTLIRTLLVLLISEHRGEKLLCSLPEYPLLLGLTL